MNNQDRNPSGGNQQRRRFNVMELLRQLGSFQDDDAYRKFLRNLTRDELIVVSMQLNASTRGRKQELLARLPQNASELRMLPQ